MQSFHPHRADVVDLQAFFYRTAALKVGSCSWPGYLLIEFFLDHPEKRFSKKPTSGWGIQNVRSSRDGGFNCWTLAYYSKRQVVKEPFTRALLWNGAGRGLNLILFFSPPLPKPKTKQFPADLNIFDVCSEQEIASLVQDDDDLVDSWAPFAPSIMAREERESPISRWLPNASLELVHQLPASIPEGTSESLVGRSVSLVPQQLGDTTRLVLVLGMHPGAVAHFIASFPTHLLPVSMMCNAHSSASLPPEPPPDGHLWRTVPVAVYGSTTVARIINPRRARSALRKGKRLCIVPVIGDTEFDRQAGLFRACSIKNVASSIGLLSEHQHFTADEDEEGCYEHWEYMLVVATTPSNLLSSSIDAHIFKVFSAFASAPSSPAEQAAPPSRHLAEEASTNPTSLVRHFELSLLALANNYPKPERRLALSRELLIPMIFEHLAHSAVETTSLSLLSSEELRLLRRYRNSKGQSPLHIAASQGNVRLVSELLAHDVQPQIMDVADGEGRTALFTAAWHGHTDVITELVRLGSKAIDTPNSEDHTPFFAATIQGYLSTAEALLHLGSQAVDKPSKEGVTPMLYAALRGRTPVIEMLVRVGSKAIDTPDQSGVTPLHLAVINGYVTTIEALVRLGSQAIDTPDSCGKTPLYTAANRGHSLIIKALVRLGSRAIDTPARNGWMPMHAAAHCGHETVIETLLRLGSRAATTPDRDGKTPKQLATESNNKTVVELLEAHALNQKLAELQLS